MAASLDNSSSDGGGDGEIAVPKSYTPFFLFFAAIAVVLFYYSMGYAKKYSTMAAFLLPPFICCCIVFDNVVMATTGIDRSKTSVQAMFAFHACVTPMLLLVCYEIAYLVHKQKSVNFCGIAFESEHRRHGGGGSHGSGSAHGRRQVLSTCLRFAVWMISLGLLVLNLLSSYAWSSGESEPELRSLYDLEGDSTAHAVFSVLPALVLVALALYIGLQLWNYGTFYSYMVHATCFNPWIWMLVGAASLLTGYLLPSPLYALSSNAGELVMMAAIVRMFREVHHDMQQDQQLRTFIDPIPTGSSPQSILTASDVVIGGGGGSSHSHSSKYELQSAASASNVRHHQHHQHHQHHLHTSGLVTAAVTGGSSDSYLQVVTPKESELRLTDDAERQAAASNFRAVVVASSRTNPLFSTTT